MINPQLLDYIRQQTASGISKESIKQALGTQGWSEQDVIEGFATLDKNITILANQTPISSITQPIKVSDNATGQLDNSVKSIWNKAIPRTNSTFMTLSLVLVFGLDLIILIISGFSLLPFWIVMLVVMGVFSIFFYIENYLLSKKFADTKSPLDKWISAIIVTRNIIFLLNFIPLIQVLGMSLLGGILAIIPTSILGGGDSFGLGGSGGFGGVSMIVPVLFLIYIVLVYSRFASTKKTIG